MKKMTKLLTILFILRCSIGVAQIYQGNGLAIKQTPSLDKKEVSDFEFLPSNNGIHSLTKVDGEFYINHYDNGLKLKGSPERFAVIPDHSLVRYVKDFRDGIIIFYETKRKKSKYESVYYLVLSKDDLSIETKPILVGEFEWFVDYYYFRVNVKRDVLLLFKQSKDKPLFVQKMSEDFEFEEEVEVESLDDMIDTDILLDEQGAIYCKGTLKKVHGPKEVTYSKMLIKYTAERTIKNSVVLKLSNHQISDGEIKFLANGNCAYVGIYEDSAYSYKTNNTYALKDAGIFYLEIDKNTLEIIKERLNPFSDDIYEIKYHGEVDSKKRSMYKESLSKHRGLSYNGWEQLKNGSIAIILEHTWMHYKSGDNPIYHVRTYDEIVVCLDPNRSVSWQQRIPKAQFVDMIRGGHSFYSGYTLSNYVFVNNELHFFYNVKGFAIADLNYVPDSPNDYYYDSHFAHLVVDGSGNKKAQSLGVIPKKEFEPLLESLNVLSDGQILFMSSTKKEYKMGTITLR